MPDLNDLRREMAAARAAAERASRDHIVEEQRLRALQQEAASLERRVIEDNQDDQVRAQKIKALIARSEDRAKELRTAKRNALTGLVDLGTVLEPITDPRKMLPKLDARYPILLFPVRLETRFVMKRDGRAEQKQLLVRIYPDDCLVDSFEPDLSEQEVKSLRRYWCAMWSAGGDEGLERAAWRELCAAHGAGRSMYIARQYAPLPGSDAVPVRGSVAEIILAVPVDAPAPASGELNNIATYWIAVWRAGNDATAITAGFNALRAALGDARAKEVRETLAPFNIKERPQAGVDRATVAVSCVFVVMNPIGTAATKRQSWTHPPEAKLLPERFVFVGDSGPEHVELLGKPVTQPLFVGPDPLAPQADQFSKANGDIIVPDQLKWMTDFETAVNAGMAFRINLSPRQAEQGFDRLYVLGVRLSSDEDQSRLELEALIQHQAKSQSGFAIVPQGTATNNSEEGSSGWTRAQEADELFDVAILAQKDEPQFDGTATARYEKSDGLRLAEALGVDASIFQDIPNADGTDQSEARAMNAALWPATLGYWMNTQMRPVFDDQVIERTRRHFIDRVSGRGTIPAVRIGKQPYGILSTTAFSRIGWNDAPDIGVAGIVGESQARRYMRGLHALLSDLDMRFWNGMAANVPRVGRRSSAPQQQLLDILGQHPSSVEFHLNVMDSAERVWNAHKFRIKGRAGLKAAMQRQMQAGLDLLRAMGYAGTTPEIIEKFFAYVHGPMNRPTIDVVPLSESDELTICTDDDKNYIEWCREKGSSAFDDLRMQNGFSAGKTPNALLYHVLRHALQLGYHQASIDLYELNGLLTAVERTAAYREPAFVHVAPPKTGLESESRYRFLYARDDVITGHPEKTVAEFIPEWIAGVGSNSVLSDQLEALKVLEHADTASLERAFAEHIDLCSYRWDAWMLSIVNEHLDTLRRPNGPDADRRKGVYLGAFGWMEDLKPDAASLPLAKLSAESQEIFQRPGDSPVQRDPANGGFLLAPSLNQAVTGAVLRSGYLANAIPAQPDVFAVDLSSSRVRVALQFVEGVRNGQPLGALLGYQLERRLHDRHNEAEMDHLIYQIRKAFPLASKRNSDSLDPAAEAAPIEQVEARNVCDGLLLLEHVRTNPSKSYPWGKTLDPATAAQVSIIDQEIKALFEIHDSIADVAVAEAVHQVTMGNSDRAAAAMDAFSKGGFPPEPDVVATPRSGTSLTHRVALHLDVSVAAAGGATPRAKAEPAIDRWLETVIPPLNNVVVRVVSQNPAPGSAPITDDIDLQTLGLRPVDLLHVLNTSDEQAMNELDDRIANHVLTTNALSPDAAIAIQYTLPVPGRTTIFEVAPLLGSLRTLVLDARPLKPSDAALQNEAAATGDAVLNIPVAQVNSARTSLTQLRTSANALLTTLNPLTPDAAAIAAVVAGIDAAITAFIALQSQASLCGLMLAGSGDVLRARRNWFELVRANADTVLKRWQPKLAAADAGIVIGNNPANSNLMRVEALEKAEREISTAYTTPIPNTPAPFLVIVNGKRTAFVAAQTAVQAVKDSAATTISALWAAWDATFAARPPIDLTEDDNVAEQDRLRLILRDMQRQVSGLIDEIDKRLNKGDKLIADAATAGGEKKTNLQIDAVKEFLGDGMRLVPRYTVSDDQGDEWQNAFDSRANLLAHLAADHEFAVDDWMHGLARVRTKIHDLENVILLTGAFGLNEPVPQPLQFPFVAAEPWLAMELPAGLDITTIGDHLLYTAIYPNDTFDKTAAAFGGLLIDEWTEVVPGTSETAGLAFHYDRPSHEPPQTMLLVTAATGGDSWSWDDLRLAVPDTFNLAKKRAVEPRDIAKTPLARFIPATLMAFTTHDVSISSGLRAADVAFTAVEGRHA